MKREILHPSCITRPKGVNANTDQFELAEIQANGEGIKHVRGKLRTCCQCDRCGGDICGGDDAVAQSLFTNRTPWYEWEHEYLSDRTEAP